MTKTKVVSRLDWIKDYLAWLGPEGTREHIEMLIADILRDTEACPKGWEDALDVPYFNEAYSCHGCVHENLPGLNYPCTYCARYYEDKYSNTKGDSNG